MFNNIYKGKKIVLTFYPAAFSGVLPEQNYSNPYPVMSCAVQLSSFDKIKPISSQIYHSEFEDEVPERQTVGYLWTARRCRDMESIKGNRL